MRLTRLLSLSIAALILAVPLSAGEGDGTTVFPLLKIGQGPRASALGESFTGLADDATAVYWNPAGLGQLTHWYVDLSHQQWLSGGLTITDDMFHAALPAGPGTVGLGLAYSGEPNVRYWDEESEAFKEFTASSVLLSAGYGWRLSDKYRLGATVTGMYENMHLFQGMGGAVDIGAFGHLTKQLNLGLAVRHLGMFSTESLSQKLPSEVALGGSYAFGKFTATLDAGLPFFDNDPNVRFGLEFAPVRAFALRAGYRTGPYSLPKLGAINGLTGGFGVTAGNFALDYAFVPYGELGLTHRIGLKTVPPLVQPPAPPKPQPLFGSQAFVVADAESKEPLAANLSTSGVYDTSATASGIMIDRAKPGMLIVKTSLPGYAPRTDTYRIAAKQERQDTIFLTRLTANLKFMIYDAKTKKQIGGSVAYDGPTSGTQAVPSDKPAILSGVAAGSYDLTATGPSVDYLPQTVTVKVVASQTLERSFYLWRKGDHLTLNINFETGKADILPEFIPVLDSAGEILKQTTTIKKVELAGHTDPRDIKTPQFPNNQVLSEARAEAVRQYLIKNFGISPERLVARGYAFSRPLVPNTSPENMYKNRRTELWILE